MWSDVHLCLSVTGCEGVMALCLVSHALGPSYLGRGDREEACRPDLVTAAVQNADSRVFHLHKMSCKLQREGRVTGLIRAVPPLPCVRLEGHRRPRAAVTVVTIA